MWDTPSIDHWLAIGGFAVGVLGIIVAIAVPLYFYRKSLRPKLLAVVYSRVRPLMMVVPGVTVTYRGAERKELSRTYILFWNRGTSPIEPSDFIAPMAFLDAEVLTVEIVRKDPMAIVVIDERTVKLGLLRPSEAFIVKVEMEKYDKPNLETPTKSANMIRTIGTNPASVFPLIFGVGSGGLSFAVTLFFLIWTWTAPKPGSIIPLIMPSACLVIGLIAFYVARGFMKRFTPDIPYRFLTAIQRDLWIDEDKLGSDTRQG